MYDEKTQGILGVNVAGDWRRSCVCFMSLFIVMACCAFHFSDGISWIPKYTYGSFW
jgi:hypothetical protein